MVGIDGFLFNTGNGYGFDPQLEAGVYEQVSCFGDLYYFASFGWQGGYSVAFDVNPGDVVYAVAIAGGSNSNVYLEDMTSHVSASYSVATPGIVGHSANWMVERICCTGNQPSALANTTNIAFGAAYWREGQVVQHSCVRTDDADTAHIKLLAFVHVNVEKD